MSVGSYVGLPCKLGIHGKLSNRHTCAASGTWRGTYRLWNIPGILTHSPLKGGCCANPLGWSYTCAGDMGRSMHAQLRPQSALITGGLGGLGLLTAHFMALSGR